MSIATIPSVFYEFAFNADPNQAAVPPYWQDLSSRVQFGWNTTRGKQYESDVNETGVWNVELANADGALDPGNTASPYYPNVLPYRRCRIRMPLGVNLLAPDQASGGEWSPLAAGPVPAWLGVSSASGYAVTVAAVGASAFQGTQVFAVAAPASGAGTKGLLQVAVPTVTAGQAYTFAAQTQVTTSGQNPQIYVSISWLNTAGAVASSTSSTPVTVTGGAGTWTALTVSGTAPATAVAAVVSVNTASAFGVATTVWVDGLQLEARGFATPWQMPWRPGINLFPQAIANATSATQWAPDAGSVAVYSNLTAAPNGATTAIGWTTPSGTTTAPNLWTGPELGNPSTSLARPSADNVQVTPGLSYTASFYGLRAASADATLALTMGFSWYTSSGAWISQAQLAQSALSTSAWVRMAFTATAPAGAAWCRTLLWISTPTLTTAQNTVFLTGGQFEQAATASTWVDPGVTAFLFNGMVERWPRTFNEVDGTYGTSKLECVDAFNALAQFTLQAPFVNEVMALGPNFFYQLNDPAGSTQVADTAGKRVPAPIENSPYGAGSLTLGNAVTATAPTTGGFVGTSGPVATLSNTSLSSGQNAETYIALHKTAVVAGPPQTGSWTRIIAFRAPAVPGAANAFQLWNSYPPSYGSLAAFQMAISATGLPVLTFSDNGGVNGLNWAGGSSVCDGNWHLLAMGVSGSSNPGWLDGAPVSTATGVGTASGWVTDVLGCQFITGTNRYTGGLKGDLAFAIELPFLLTNTQMASLYSSWRSASTGESTGSRYQRVLNWIGWTGATAVDAGQTAAMGPATDLTGNSALDALNLVTLTENGDNYVSAAGALTFKARSAFYNTRAPAVVFGEGLPVGNAGEWPVEIGSFDFDPSHLASTVQVQDYEGSLYQAGNAASRQRFFPRVYSRQINTASASEPQDAANYLLGQLKDPKQRADVIRWHPAAVLGALPIAAQIDKGVRARLVKRPVGGAPSTSLDAFIQKIDWTWTDESDVWVEYQASPADLTNYGVLAALHTTLAAQATAGTNTATINALPDAAYNKLAQSLPAGYQLTFEPGTARAETRTIAAGGIPSTSLGYTSAVLTFTANLSFTHAAGTAVCEPLPAGYTDPTTWDASAVIGATATTVLSGGGAGTATVTVGPLPDAAYNALGSTWNTNDTVTLSPGTANAETMTILSVATTYPGYTSCQITFTANLAHSHAVGDTVCDPLPAGVTTPAALSPTLRLAY